MTSDPTFDIDHLSLWIGESILELMQRVWRVVARHITRTRVAIARYCAIPAALGRPNTGCRRNAEREAKGPAKEVGGVAFETSRAKL